jgi:kanamycin nucleotidyltransferase
MEHQQRMMLAQTIANRLIIRYGESVKAIGLYGSLARGEDGPYSDVEMFCVLRETGTAHTYEWCAGPWKAEVDVLDEGSLRQEASQIDGLWALTHGAFVRVLPVRDPENYFDELRELVMSHPPEIFRVVIEEVLVGDIYELIGKVRNACVQKHAQALPTLAVELAQRTAYALGLEHRYLYGTSSYVFDEAITLPDPPDGFHTLAHLVMRGDLQDASTVASACDTLWLGLVRWAEGRGYTLVASQEIPF